MLTILSSVTTLFGLGDRNMTRFSFSSSSSGSGLVWFALKMAAIATFCRALYLGGPKMGELREEITKCTEERKALNRRSNYLSDS